VAQPAQLEHRQRRVDRVPQAPEQGDARGEPGVCQGWIAQVSGGRSKVLQCDGLAGRIPEPPPERQALLQERRRSRVLAASGRDVAGAIQRACPRSEQFRGGVAAAGAERECLLEPVQALDQVAVLGPETPEGARQPQRVLGLAPPDDPAQRRPEVLDVGRQAHHPFTLVGPAQLGLGLLGQRQETGRVPAAGLVRLAMLDEPLVRVLLERLEHPVAVGAIRVHLGQHERPVEQVLEDVEHLG
jgi:hypothetical protein